jgi:hypothetical protein
MKHNLRCVRTGGGGGKRWGVHAVLLAGVLLWSGGVAWAQSARPEYEVKAEFIPLFASFVTWPTEAFSDAGAPLVIGVLGDDPFGEALDRAVRKESSGEARKMVIRRSRQWQDLKGCHILFVGKSERDRLSQLLKNVDKLNILTVGEMEGFTQAGGVIKFFIQGSKVRFEINVEAARRNGLKISSQLLSLGKTVGGKTI